MRPAPALPRALRLVHPVLPAREWPSDRQVPARRACARRNTARGSRDRGRPLPTRRGVHGLRGGARALAPRARHLRARVDAGGRVDHRRRDEARAGSGERCRGGRLLAALRRRARCAREALTNRAPKPYRPHADTLTRPFDNPSRGDSPEVERRESDDGQARIRGRAHRGSPGARSRRPVPPSRRTGSRRRDPRPPGGLRASRGQAQALRARIGEIQATQERIRAKIASGELRPAQEARAKARLRKLEALQQELKDKLARVLALYEEKCTWLS